MWVQANWILYFVFCFIFLSFFEFTKQSKHQLIFNVKGSHFGMSFQIFFFGVEISALFGNPLNAL